MRAPAIIRPLRDRISFRSAEKVVLKFPRSHQHSFASNICTPDNFKASIAVDRGWLLLAQHLIGSVIIGSRLTPFLHGPD